MSEAAAIADPERALSVSYAPAEARVGLEALWMLDERLGAIVAGTSTGAIGQMRLTWWHDALVALGSGPAPAEPVLAALSGLTIDPALWPRLVDGWEVLLEPLPLSMDQLEQHARGRGATLFEIGAELLGEAADVSAAGARWALVDFAFRISDHATAEAALALARRIATPAFWPPRLRSLGMLSVLAGRDAAAGLGQPRRPGSPGRVARALMHRISGR